MGKIYKIRQRIYRSSAFPGPRGGMGYFLELHCGHVKVSRRLPLKKAVCPECSRSFQESRGKLQAILRTVYHSYGIQEIANRDRPFLSILRRHKAYTSA